MLITTTENIPGHKYEVLVKYKTQKRLGKRLGIAPVFFSPEKYKGV